MAGVHVTLLKAQDINEEIARLRDEIPATNSETKIKKSDGDDAALVTAAMTKAKRPGKVFLVAAAVMIPSLVRSLRTPAGQPVAARL